MNFHIRIYVLIFLPWLLAVGGMPATAQETVLDLDFQTPASLGKPSERVGNPAIRTYTGKSMAMFLDGSSYLKLDGTADQMKFDNGDTITVEAWVAPQSLHGGQQIYILGKGRTQNPRFPKENQNYGLRLRGENGLAKISFLFRTVNPQSKKQQFNRWNSKTGFHVDGSWHHVAIHYPFGKPQNIVAFLDGKQVAGSWDMGGPTLDPPVVDNDELWIGSSLGGNPASTFAGWMRNVRITRNQNSFESLVKRGQAPPPPLPLATVDDSELDNGQVLLEIVEQVPEQAPPLVSSIPPAEKFFTGHLALRGLPKKYTRPGVIADRSATFLVRCRVRKTLAEGNYEILVRAKSATALLIDNRVVGTLPMMKRNASGHEAVPELTSYANPVLYPPPAGHQEMIVEKTFPKGEFVFRLETLVGGKGLRNELGELVVGIRIKGEKIFQIVSNANSPLQLTRPDWQRRSLEYQQQVREIEKSQRVKLAAATVPYWNKRRQMAKQLAKRKWPNLQQASIDVLVSEHLHENNMSPLQISPDTIFLRRVYLDTLGIPPGGQQVQDFLKDKTPGKRNRIIEQLLDHPGYADHWVSYWQDVLAENPGILKPKLNNTGPFRFWIYESLLDNKPMDRFASELIGMKGSRTGGGPAGFGQATQNDVPFAAKANVLARAFLGIDLTCARCHDSPNSHFVQKDLFEMAAMLNGKPITLPASSTVPNAASFSGVKVTLEPGEPVNPKWPFTQDLGFQLQATSADPRAQLAEWITGPHNDRFAQVIANRIWTRLFGVGLMDSPDDFLLGKPRHPRLLDYLASYLVAHHYDAKKLVRLILSSQTYQRMPTEDEKQVIHFAGRKIRTMTAEQLVDSLFSVAGKQMELGEISFDPEGRRTADTFLNLGNPRRAWELTSLANERDRPALALPRAQSVVDILTAYGWRESRPNPLSQRDHSRTLVQPLIISNGDATHRVVQLSDDSSFTHMAYEAEDLAGLVHDTFYQLLGRAPSNIEIQIGKEWLNSGFDSRKIPGATPAPLYANQFRSAVSWSNHLHPEATRIKLEIEKAVRQGDFATGKLKPDWRKRMEDLVWALFNSPEFFLIR